MKIRGNLQVRGTIISVAHFREERTSGTSPSSLNPDTWNTITLNTTVVNGIENASISSNAVTLPKGKYWVNGVVPCKSAADESHDYRSRIQNTTDGDTLLLGPGVGLTSLTESFTWLVPVEGIIVLPSTKVIELQCYPSGTTELGHRTSISGINEVFAELFIWKI